MMTPRVKAQQGLGLIYEAMLDLLRQHPDGLSHVKTARTLGIEMGYLAGDMRTTPRKPSFTNFVATGKVEKIGENRNAIFRLK